MKSNNSNYDEDAARMNPDGVVVPDEVYEGIEACRQSGHTNMFAMNVVQKWCHDHDYHHAVVWMDENGGKYAEAMFKGMCPESEANNDEGDADV